MTNQQASKFKALCAVEVHATVKKTKDDQDPLSYSDNEKDESRESEQEDTNKPSATKRGLGPG